jgi:hypothetical protein
MSSPSVFYRFLMYMNPAIDINNRYTPVIKRENLIVKNKHILSEFNHWVITNSLVVGAKCL